MSVAPLRRPGTIVGVMFGVRPPDPDATGAPAHFVEMMRDPTPRLFLKTPSSVIAAGEPIRVPANAGHVIAECEVALVVGRDCTRVPVASAWEHVAGVVIANDVTAVDFILSDGDFVRGKCQPTFCPVGDVVVPLADESVLIAGVRATTWVDGRPEAAGSTADLFSSPSEVLSAASHATGLHAGDLILLGSVAAARIVPGVTVAIEVDGVGRLENPVVAVS